jgi:NitT/TauT family transport system substrate-binding protein
MKKLVFGLLWLLLPGVGGLVEAETLPTVKLRLPWLHQSQYAGVYAAREAGLFARRGVRVEILQGGPNIRPMDLVSSGAEQFSITGSSPFFRAYAEQRPLKIVATLDQTHAFCYFARQDQGIAAPADFRGQRVGHKIMHEHNLLALLQAAGLTQADIELVPAPPGMSLFFINDPARMVPIWPGHAADEPLLAEERGIAVNYFFPEDYDGVPRIGNLLFTSQAFEQAHPDVVASVVAALIEGWEYAFRHVDEAVDWTMQYRRSEDAADRRHQRNMLLKMQDFMLVERYGGKIGWCDRPRWQDALAHFLRDHPEADFTLDDILTNRYVEQYYQAAAGPSD